MEAAQEGHLELVKYLLAAGEWKWDDANFVFENYLFSQETKQETKLFFLNQGANVHATTATGDTALTYACENGHTDVADVLLQDGANLVFYGLNSSL